MTKEMIIKRLQWAINDKDWDAVKLLKGDLEEMDNGVRSERWAVKQYNRNRIVEDHAKEFKDIHGNPYDPKAALSSGQHDFSEHDD